MRLHHSALVLACISSCFAIESDSSPGDLKPYPLPPAARAGIEKLAASSDILILGEIHGTQEVPELVASLLAPLTELGYNTLALEVPNEEQASLLAWARGKSERIPKFFAKPSGDGRGNAQLLALTRVAISPPYRWQIICFDDSESNLEKQYLALMQKNQKAAKADVAQLTADDGIAIWRVRRRDGVESDQGIQVAQVPNKILAVCGNIHVRVAHDGKDPMLSKLWPSFAGMLKQGQPAWRVRAVNIELYSGAYFNNGKVQRINKRPLEHCASRTFGSGWVGFGFEVAEG